MSTAHSSVTDAINAGPDEIDLGLDIPGDFALQALFPGDRLLRLHPNWFVDGFEEKEGFFTAPVKDYASEEEFLLTGGFGFHREKGELLQITLTDTIEFTCTFLSRNGRLKLTVDRELAVDDPLLLWIRAIREYIRIYLKRTPVTLFFRAVMNKMILQMNPSQRKICLMLMRLTILEIFVILLIVVGYFFFMK